MLTFSMSEDDMNCLREFMDAGNGEAMFSYVEDTPRIAGGVDEYIELLRKSADAGHHPAAEELASIFSSGRAVCFDGDDFIVPIDMAESEKYARLANVLKHRWDDANAGRVLVCDFAGWMQIRCGKHTFYNSYLFPTFPLEILDACIDKIDNGGLISEWFSDENHGHDLEEQFVGGKLHLCIKWNDDSKESHCEEFPDYDFRRFAAQIANDIESNYFGWAYFMTSCDGGGLRQAVERLKRGVMALHERLNAQTTTIAKA